MGEKYQKIIVILSTLIIFLLIFTPVSTKTTNLPGDIIDQEQTQTSGKDYIYSDHWKAQSFKPATKTLTRILLYINKLGDITSDFEISIKDSLTGENLTNCSVSSSEIPPANPEWVEFNFLDINVIVNQTYYIVCKTSTGDQSNSYNWYEAFNDPYEPGAKYYSDDNGVIWQQSPDYDFCFKTFGQKAELDIPYIRGGHGWNIYYGIENIGILEVTDIAVDIIFSGGLILTGKTHTGDTVQTIAPGEIKDNIFFPVIGLGPTKITITVSSPEVPATSKTAQAFLFLFSIYITPL